MSFVKKLWKNRVSDYPTRRLITPVGQGDAFVAEIERNDATITVRGTTVTVDSFSLSSYCWAQNDEGGETTSNTNTVYTCTIT